MSAQNCLAFVPKQSDECHRHGKPWEREHLHDDFTIDAENNITANNSRKAAKETGHAVFATEEQFAELIGADNKRLVEIFNSLPGVKPVTKFANRKVAPERIWKAIQSLGENTPEVAAVQDLEPAQVAPEESQEAPQTDEPQPALAPAVSEAEGQPTTEVPAENGEPAPSEPLADAGAQAADIASAEATPTNGATPAKKARKAKTPVKTEPAGVRGGSKTAQVIEMLQRKNGATLSEIMTTMGWQKHTVRGFMASAMKKAGYTVESFKPEGGERTYRINK